MLLSSLATSIYARITFVLGLCAWGIPTAVGFSQMTSCRLQSNYSSMVVTAPLVTRPVLTAVKTAAKKYRPSQRPSRRPVSDGSCVRDFTKTNCLIFLVSFVVRIMSWQFQFFLYHFPVNISLWLQSYNYN